MVASTKDAFMRAYSHLFENSPWVIDRAWAKRPFIDRKALHSAFLEVLAEASAEERLDLARAHPELGDKVAMAQGLTESSAKEQSSAGLDRLSPSEYESFRALNAAYRHRHGFPFIICVKLHNKNAILSAMMFRSEHDSSVELDEAMTQIGLISWLRLSEIP